MTQQKSFNSQVYTMACNRLKLNRREKTIFYRLLGFLLRNDKPFPYSTGSLSDVTGYSRSSIFESFNLLEKLRLIQRIGIGKARKFSKGSILKRICSLIHSRIIHSENFFNREEILKKRRNEFSKFYSINFMKIIERDGNKCNYCKKESKLTIDHIYPVSKGGEDFLTNLQLLCQPCNSSKSNKL